MPEAAEVSIIHIFIRVKKDLRVHPRRRGTLAHRDDRGFEVAHDALDGRRGMIRQQRPALASMAFHPIDVEGVGIGHHNRDQRDTVQ